MSSGLAELAQIPWTVVLSGSRTIAQVDYLKAENLLLREKLGTKRVRLTDAERRRLAMLGKALGRKGLTAIATIASPETILRWYRELVAKKYDGSQQRGQGRPKTAANIAAIIVKMASENSWGYTRIEGAQEPGPRSRTKHDQAYSPGEWHRPGARAGKANVVGDLHQSAPRRNRRHGLLHGGSNDVARTGSLPRAVRDRYRK
jgi:hypothetical protein